jgi:hypothetical protein
MITVAEARDIVTRSLVVDRNNEAYKLSVASVESLVTHAAMLGETSTSVFIDEPFVSLVVEDLTNAGFTVELDDDSEFYIVSW